MSAFYRVRQFVLAAAAWMQCGEPAAPEVERLLPRAAVALFRQMPRYDRSHALRVMRTLSSRGYTGPELLAAALLHDLGKSARPTGRLRLWHRVAVVVMGLAPGLVYRIADDRPGSWREPFFVQAHHAELGAEWARRAGCSPVTVELIRHHEGPLSPDDPCLAALQAADGAS